MAKRLLLLRHARIVADHLMNLAPNPWLEEIRVRAAHAEALREQLHHAIQDRDEAIVRAIDEARLEQRAVARVAQLAPSRIAAILAAT